MSSEKTIYSSICGLFPVSYNIILNLISLNRLIMKYILKHRVCNVKHDRNFFEVIIVTKHLLSIVLLQNVFVYKYLAIVILYFTHDLINKISPIKHSKVCLASNYNY